MFDYLQQFNSLPKDLRDKVSSKEVMAFLNDLESRYQVDLAMVVMKVMIKTLAVKDLSSTFVSEFNLAPDKAEALSQEMKKNVFSAVSDYVGLTVQPEKIDVNENIELLIKEAGITIANSDLAERLKKVISTYLRGVRQRIDTRQALAKEVASGGLGLSEVEIDRVFKVCDSKKFESKNTIVPPVSPIDKIIEQNVNTNTAVSPDKQKLFTNVAEYDLKRALATGETKRISPPHPALINNAEGGDKSGVVKSEKDIKTEKETDTQKEIEDELKKLEGDGKEKQVIKEEIKEVADKTPKPAEEVKAKEPFIVRKPESSSMFKSLFAESQKKASPGAVKFAQVAQSQIKPVTPPIVKNTQNRQPEKKTEEKNEAVKNVSKRSIQQPINRKKPRLDDVKPAPKVMGPIEELMYLDVTNFRRLGKTPEEITGKIYSKIKLLEGEGYDKMIAGISAWKKSPVNRMYMKIVQVAIANGKTVKEIATAGALKGSLNYEEIEAIINLNSRLTF